MARARSKGTGPRNALLATLALVLLLLGGLAGLHQWRDASLTPKLGLDLEGGTQMVLSARLQGSDTVSAEQLSQARDIIVQRVDAGGISGAEVTTQGERNIVVSIPGTPSEETLNAIQRSSELVFRPVLAVAAGGVDPSASPSASASASLEASSSATPSGTSSPTPTTPDTALPSAGTDATSLEWISPSVQQAFTDLNCLSPTALDNVVDDRTKPLVTCDETGAVKYILGPVVVAGSEISDAAAGFKPLPNGQPSTEVEISLGLNSEGAKKYAEISKKMVALAAPQNQLAAALDSRVIVAPKFNEAILDGKASITGGFTIESARSLAQQLKFGALPTSFVVETREQISPTLGSEQLRYGLLAGLVGLLLVVVYSVFQYRVLGLVTVASIALAALVTYLTITLLGWAYNYRLDMAGVTGLIVAIGFTADSFIVYFERVRDELRAGRALESAVATGWDRAKRTILIADGVNFLAAGVLYLLASSNVRGFAFTLGLTTLIDVLLVFLFTHPMVALLARRPFFRDGHPWSGLDPRRLGAVTRTYAGRGRFTTPATGTQAGAA